MTGLTLGKGALLKARAWERLSVECGAGQESGLCPTVASRK